MMPAAAASGGSAAGPLRPWAGGFAEWLSGQGYTQETIVGYLRWLGWLSDWLAGQGLAAGALNEARAGRFAASMRAAGHPKISPGRLATMLCYLREAGTVPPEGASPSSAAPRQQLLAAYQAYMTARDLAPGTVTTRLRVAAMFLDGLGGDTATDAVAHLTPRQVLVIFDSWGRLATSELSLSRR